MKTEHDVFTCPVCRAEYEELTPEYDLVIDELYRRAGLKEDDRVSVTKMADWLDARAPMEATSSRDYGRGFAHAAKLLRGFRP